MTKTWNILSSCMQIQALKVSLQTDLEMINGRLMRLYKYAVHEQTLIKNELLVRRYCVLPKCHSCEGITSHYQLSSINHMDTTVQGVIRVTLNTDKLTQFFYWAYFKLLWILVSFRILRAFLERAFPHGSGPKIYCPKKFSNTRHTVPCSRRMLTLPMRGISLSFRVYSVNLQIEEGQPGYKYIMTLDQEVRTEILQNSDSLNLLAL